MKYPNKDWWLRIPRLFDALFAAEDKGFPWALRRLGRTFRRGRMRRPLSARRLYPAVESLETRSLPSSGNASPHPEAVFTPTADVPYSGNVGRLYQQAGDSSAAPAAAEVAWGDGTNSTGTVLPADANGGFQVLASHTYDAAGDFAVQISATDAGGNTLTATNTAQVTGTLLTPHAVSYLADSGTYADTLGYFTDGRFQDMPDGFQASISWGDGGTSDGTVAGQQGRFNVDGRHTYAQDATYSVTVSVQDSAGDSTSWTSTLYVGTQPEGAFVLPHDPSISAVEAEAWAGGSLGTFTDTTDTESYVMDSDPNINWGDGNAETGSMTYLGSGVYEVDGPAHTYIEEGTYSIWVHVDSNENPGTYVTQWTDSATVSDPNVSAASGGSVSATEGTSTGTITLATFTDAGNPSGGEISPSYSADIDWGDGNGYQSGAGTIYTDGYGNYQVHASHTYTDEDGVGSSISVRINHEGSTSQTVTDSLTLTDPSVSATGGYTITPVEDQTSGSQTLATFTDPADPSGTIESTADYSASINWGDGTSATTGTITGSGGTYTVKGTHSYGDNNSETGDSYTITVTISHESSSSVQVTDTASVSEPAVTVSFSSSKYTVTEPSQSSHSIGSELITVNLSAAVDDTVTVDYFTISASDCGCGSSADVVQQILDSINTKLIPSADPPAIVGTDYQPAAGSLTFNPGDTSKTFTVPILADPAADGDVDLDLVLDHPGPGFASLPGNEQEDFAVLTIEDNTDVGTVYTHDSCNDVTGESFPDGSSKSMSYIGDPELHTVTNQLNQTTTYTYDGSGNLLTVTNPLNQVRTYTYNAANQVTSETTPGAGGSPVTTSFLYDGNGMLTEVLYPDATDQQFTYDANENLHTSTDQRGNTTTYLYDGHLLTETIDPLGNTTKDTYYSTGQLKTVTDALNNVTTYTYDSNGNIATITKPGPLTTTFVYDSNHELLSVTDPRNETTTYTYTGDGRISTVTDATNAVTTYTYNDTTHTVTVTDPLGHLSTSTSDAEGRLISQTNALSATTTNLYDAAGNLTGTLDANSHLTQFLYDALNRQTVTIDALGHRTTSLFDAAGNMTGQLDANGHLTEFLFDVNNRQTVTIDALGNRTTSILDADGNVTGTLDANNNLTQFLYDADNRQTVTIDALGNRATSLFDAGGNMTGQLDANSNLTKFLFDADNRQTVVIDGLGHRTTSLLDADGNVTETIDANSNITTFLYDADNRQTVTIDALNHRTTSLFDAAGNMTGQLDANSNLTEFLYDAVNRQTVAIDALSHRTTSLFDAAGNMTGALDANDNLTQFLFDADNRQTVTVDALGHRTTSLFDAAGNMTGALDANDNLTQFLFDADNRQTVVIDAMSNRATSLLDPAGNITGSLDPDNNLTQFLFDADNRQTVTIDALGHRTTSLFDAAGNMTGQYDGRDNLTEYVYDADNRASVTIDALGHRTTLLFDAAGNMTGSLDANSHLTKFLFDADNRQTVTVDALGNRTTSLFDAAGNMTGSLDAASHLTQFIFDADNRQTVTVDPLSNRTTSLLDSAGNVTATIDPNSHETQFLLDADNRQTVTIDALSNRTTVTFDAAGNELTLKDSKNNVTTFVYDWVNRETEEITPIGTATFAYDAAGLQTSTTNANGDVTDYLFDADGRQTGQLWYNSSSTLVNTVTFTYDQNGNILTAANNNGAYSFVYDAVNRLDYVSEPFSQGFTFMYDNVGNRTGAVDSQGGTTTSTYDAANNLSDRQFSSSTGQNPMNMELTYTALNQIATETSYSDLSGSTEVARTSYLYDAAGRTTSIQDVNSSSTSLASFLYSYDNAGNVATQTANGVVTSYTYDADNELTSDGATSLTFDGEGNRTNTGYSTGSDNELSSDGTYDYTYDNAGNEITKTNIATGDEWTYTYDNLNELTQAVDKTATGVVEMTVTYKYGPFQERLEEDVTVGSTTTVTRFAYDGWKTNLDAFDHPAAYVGNENGDVWVDMDSSNHLQTRYLRGDLVDQLFAREDSGNNLYWILTDEQNSTRAVIDNSANVKDYVSYDGWGNATQTNSTYGGRYLYTGREWDVETGLQYNRARYYDPGSGRWISPDPRGFGAGDSNLYRYARNAATIAIDPSGLWQITRAGAPTAKALPDEGDTIQSLADLIGLDVKERAAWLRYASPNKNAPAINDIPVDKKLTKDCPAFSIPNTILAIYALNAWRDLGQFLSAGIAAGFDSSMDVLKKVGFNVVIENVKPTWTDTTPTSGQILTHITTLSANAELYGFWFTGHGLEEGMRLRWPNLFALSESVILKWSEVAGSLKYRLGLVVANACYSWNGAKTLAAPGATVRAFDGWTSTLSFWSAQSLFP